MFANRSKFAVCGIFKCSYSNFRGEKLGYPKIFSKIIYCETYHLEESVIENIKNVRHNFKSHY